jgi:hypothetical protein
VIVIPRGRDSTRYVLDYFLGLRAILDDAPRSDTPGDRREQGAVVLDAYIETLQRLGSRTGMLIGSR